MAGQLWAVSSLGAYMYRVELSNVMRTDLQPLLKFRQFCDARDFTDKGLHSGQTFSWNVYSDLAQQETTLTETSTVNETNFTIIEGTGRVTEWGNSVPYTGMLEDLSEHWLLGIIRKVLKNDVRKVLDGQFWNQFNSTPLKVVPSGSGSQGTSTYQVTLTTNGIATLTNSMMMNNLHINAIVDIMKARNIPAYFGDEYFGLAWPTTWRPVKNLLEGVYQYRDEGFQMIYNGE